MFRFDRFCKPEREDMEGNVAERGWGNPEVLGKLERLMFAILVMFVMLLPILDKCHGKWWG